jgi:hypothetical protein
VKETDMTQRKRNDSLVWGIILITVGVLFLLQSLDIHVWDFVARMWPVVLIIWGASKLYAGIKERSRGLAEPAAGDPDHES